MIPETWIRRLGHLSCVALVLLSGAWVQAQQPSGPQPPPPREHSDHEHAEHEHPEKGPSPFWLGITCRPVDDALRAQLGLPEGQGLVVADVAPDSPAAAAEIARHDVLLKAGDQELRDVRGLMAAVDEAGHKEAALSLTLLRQGEEKTVEVKPQKRERPDGPPPGELSPRRVEDLARMLQEQLGREGVRIAIPRPGFIVRDVFGAFELPKDVSITVEKHGREPGKVTVTRGEEKWEATEDDLAKLPDELRGHAERMLGRMPPLPPDVLHWFGTPGEQGPPPPGGPDGPPRPDGPPGARGPRPFNIPLPGPGDIERMLDHRLEAINARLEKLQQAIEELRQAELKDDK